MRCRRGKKLKEKVNKRYSSKVKIGWNKSCCRLLRVRKSQPVRLLLQNKRSSFWQLTLCGLLNKYQISEIQWLTPVVLNLSWFLAPFQRLSTLVISCSSIGFCNITAELQYLVSKGLCSWPPENCSVAPRGGRGLGLRNRGLHQRVRRGLNLRTGLEV